MNKKTKIIIAVCALFIVVGFVVMFGSNIFSHKSSYETMPEANAISAEIGRNTTIEQTFECDLDTVNEVAIVFTRIDEPQIDEEEDYCPTITIELLCDEEVLVSKEYQVNDIEDQHRTFLTPDSPLTGLKNKNLTLRISNDGYLNTGLALMIQNDEIKTFEFNQMNIQGTICFNISGE